MEKRKDSRLAWKIWNLLDEFNSILWNVYEEEFMEFCQKDYTRDPAPDWKDDDNEPF